MSFNFPFLHHNNYLFFSCLIKFKLVSRFNRDYFLPKKKEIIHFKKESYLKEKINLTYYLINTGEVLQIQNLKNI